MGLMMVQKEEKYFEEIGQPMTKQNAHDFYEKIVGFEPVRVESNYARKFSKKPLKIFVNSMSDLSFWHDEWIFRVLHRIEEYPNHIFMILTKFPSVYLLLPYYLHMFPQNLWLGVTVTNQKDADERIPVLLQSKAAMKFVSIEPMVGPVDLSDYVWGHDIRDYGEERDAIDWVIVGGMTGSGAVPMHPDWVRSMRDQCKEAGVPFFFKSWGEYVPKRQTDLMSGGYEWGTIDYDGDYFKQTTPWNGHDDDGNGEAIVYRLGKKQTGDLIDGVQYHEFPEGK